MGSYTHEADGQSADGLWHKLPHGVIDRLMLLSGTAVKTYLALAKYADFKTGECYPGTAKIRDDIKVKDPKTVRGAVMELVDAKLLTKTTRKGEGGKLHDCNLYRLIGVSAQIPLVESQPGPPCSDSPTPSGTGSPTPPGANSPTLRAGIPYELEPGDEHQGTRDIQQAPTNKGRGKAASVSVDQLLFPLGMDTPEVRQAMEKWLKHKRGKRNSFSSPDGPNELLELWAADGPAAFVAAVRHSIASNYSGVFSPPAGGSKNGHDRNAREREASSQDHVTPNGEFE